MYRKIIRDKDISSTQQRPSYRFPAPKLVKNTHNSYNRSFNSFLAFPCIRDENSSIYYIIYENPALFFTYQENYRERP